MKRTDCFPCFSCLRRKNHYLMKYNCSTMSSWPGTCTREATLVQEVTTVLRCSDTWVLDGKVHGKPRLIDSMSQHTLAWLSKVRLFWRSFTSYLHAVKSWIEVGGLQFVLQRELDSWHRGPCLSQAPGIEAQPRLISSTFFSAVKWWGVKLKINYLREET